MKSINDYIVEKFKLNSKTLKKSEYLEPEEIKDPETPGKDYLNNDVIIIGWPFQKEGDENYKKTKEYIKKCHYRINYDFGDIDDPEFFDWFCYAINTDKRFFNSEKEVNCYVYGTEGAIALNK